MVGYNSHPRSEVGASLAKWRVYVERSDAADGDDRADGTGGGSAIDSRVWGAGDDRRDAPLESRGRAVGAGEELLDRNGERGRAAARGAGLGGLARRCALLRCGTAFDAEHRGESEGDGPPGEWRRRGDCRGRRRTVRRSRRHDLPAPRRRDGGQVRLPAGRAGRVRFATARGVCLVVVPGGCDAVAVFGPLTPQPLPPDIREKGEDGFLQAIGRASAIATASGVPVVALGVAGPRLAEPRGIAATKSSRLPVRASFQSG